MFNQENMFNKTMQMACRVILILIDFAYWVVREVHFKAFHLKPIDISQITLMHLLLYTNQTAF